jgi:capsular exopolysaccharide synthesis family protein
MGERVLLVDCDLRRGRQHVLLKLDNSQGMSHMLTGQISPRAAVLSTGQKGFDAIPRGPIIPGSTEMLCQEGFALLVQEWRTRYDRIILDCPPVLGLSESASLQRLADGLVLVVRSEKTSMKDVKDAVTLLRKTGAHFFGFVLNGVDLSKIGNYYQYYYYSAQYYDQFDGEPEEITGSLGGGPIVGVNTAPLPQPLPDPDLAPKPHSPSTIAPPAGAASQVTRRQPAQEAAKSGAAPVRQEPPAPGAVPAPVQTAHAKPIAPPLAGRPAAAGFSPEEPNRQQARAEQERRQLESEWSQVAERKPTRTPRPPSEPS